MKTVAREIMNSPVICAETRMLVSDLIEAFKIHRISCVPVYDEKGKLAGLVSDTDVVSKCGAFCGKVVSEKEMEKGPRFPGIGQSRGFHVEEYSDPAVEDIMSRDVVSADPGASVGDLVDLMLQRKVHRVVIVEDGRPIGIVSSLDLVSCLLDPAPCEA